MLRSRFGQSFSPSRWLRRTDGLQLVREGGNGQEWILARGLCAFTTLDGAAVPARKRRGYAEMAIARWAPFADPQSMVEWSGDRAMVWAWSKSQVLAVDAGEALRVPPRRIVPETLHRGLPAQDGEELAAMDEGYEGRLWRGGMLAASHWWQAMPTTDGWNQFRRGIGLPPADRVPEPLSHALSERSWSAPQLRGISAAVGSQPKLAMAVLGGVACAARAALLVGVVALEVSIWQVDRQIQAREQALGKIIDARANALSDIAKIEAELDMRPPSGQTRLMAEVDALMGASWQLREWRMPDPAHLEVVAQMRNPDLRAIVSAWEGSGRFTGVTADMGRGPDEIRVKSVVKRKGVGAAR